MYGPTRLVFLPAIKCAVYRAVLITSRELPRVRLPRDLLVRVTAGTARRTRQQTATQGLTST